MFKNQTDDTNISHQDLNQADDLKIEDIPIHTMTKDLQEIEHPTAAANMADDNLAVKPTSNIQLTEKQKTSPFLNPTSPKDNNSQPKTPTSQIEKRSGVSFFDSFTSSQPKQNTQQKPEEMTPPKQAIEPQKLEAKPIAPEMKLAEAPKKVEEQKAQSEVINDDPLGIL